MSAAQASLFDYAASRGASRADGPQTSRDAGRSMSGQVLRDQQALVLEAVAAHGVRGANAHEVQVWLRNHDRPVPERNAIGSRFRELREFTPDALLRHEGEREGVSGRQGWVHVATAAGRQRMWAILRERGAA